VTFVIQTINAQIERFSGLAFTYPSFPDALEDRFEADSAERRSRRLALEGLLAILFFDLFLIADRYLAPIDFHQALILRLGIVTPILLLINYRLWRNPGLLFRESAIVFGACLGGLTHLYIEGQYSAVNSAYAQAGLLSIIIYANAIARLRFSFALAASTIMIAGNAVFLRSDHLLLPHQKLLGLAITLTTVIVSLIANYSSNREERLSYLLALRGDFLLEDLHRSHERLADMAETDGLTGLPNRLSFDTRFEALWQRSIDAATPFSLLMVDVDHFKRINDTHGHLYGDKVLRRIARLVLESLRREDDFACRFGGEEFVILLPGTAQPAAMLVAERLRNLVNLAGFPPIDATQLLLHPIATLGATVSCGVASTHPKTPEERHLLLSAADKAMYEAKHAGRNRVCLAIYEPRTTADRRKQSDRRTPTPQQPLAH
jgi:diguanylate cyclase (GGDEF)-like protein